MVPDSMFLTLSFVCDRVRVFRCIVQGWTQLVWMSLMRRLFLNSIAPQLDPVIGRGCTRPALSLASVSITFSLYTYFFDKTGNIKHKNE